MSLKRHLFVNQQYNMDAIDITDSAFALDTPSVNNVLNGGDSTFADYTLFIYVGAAILVVVIGMFIFKLYQNKKNQQEDCPGGFCTMEHRPTSMI